MREKIEAELARLENLQGAPSNEDMKSAAQCLGITKSAHEKLTDALEANKKALDDLPSTPRAALIENDISLRTLHSRKTLLENKLGIEPKAGLVVLKPTDPQYKQVSEEYSRLMANWDIKEKTLLSSSTALRKAAEKLDVSTAELYDNITETTKSLVSCHSALERAQAFMNEHSKNNVLEISKNSELLRDRAAKFSVDRGAREVSSPLRM